MKAIFTFLLLSAITISQAYSQALIPIPNDSATITAQQIDEFEPTDVHIELINNSANAITITWRMKDYVAPSSWELKLCDNNNCYDLLIGNPVHESLTVGAGDTMDMKFQFTAHCIAGSASANVIAYVTGDSANTAVVLNYQANLTVTCVNGINDIATGKTSIFPNPANNNILVSSSTTAISFCRIFDNTGREIQPKLISNSNSGVNINIENIDNGVYYVQSFDEKGKMISTSKFVKSGN
jgi:hypothetical protein